MRKTVYICDHCGKQFDAINGYSDFELDNFNIFSNVDLCTDCYNELTEIVYKFVNKELKYE